MYSYAEEGGVGGARTTPPGDENPFPNGPSMTYFPVPFFLSSRGLRRAPCDDVPQRGALRQRTRRCLARRGERARLRDHRSTCDASPLPRSTTTRAIPAGRRCPPRGSSARGVASNRGALSTASRVYSMREANLPITAVDDAMHFLPALRSSGIEDELAQWTSDAHAAGYKVMAYNNPYVATDHREREGRPRLRRGRTVSSCASRTATSPRT